MAKAWKIRIRHPVDGESVPRRFVAYGAADTPPIRDVSAELRDNTGTLLTAAQVRQTVLQRPPHWKILLEFLVPPNAGPYKLTVLDPTDPANRTDTSERLQIGAFGGVAIAYPATGETVCQEFTAYGTSDDLGPITGRMTRSDGYSRVGNVCYWNPPVWAIAFGGLEESQGLFYTLSVSVISTQMSTGITVRSCPGAG